MAKKCFWKAFLVILSVMVFVYCGCVTSTLRPNWGEKPLEGSEYTVLGTVILEKNWYGILGVPLFNLLGITIPSNVGMDLFLIQWGGASYSELLNVAKRQYPGTDAVVNVIADYRETNSLISLLFLKREIKLTGIAISYDKESVSEVSAQTTQNNKTPVFNEPNSIVVDIWKFGRRYNDLIKTNSAIFQDKPLHFTIFGYDSKNERWVRLGETELKHFNDRFTIHPPGRRILGQFRWFAIQSNDEIEFNVNVALSQNDVILTFFTSSGDIPETPQLFFPSFDNP